MHDSDKMIQVLEWMNSNAVVAVVFLGCLAGIGFTNLGLSLWDRLTKKKK